VTSLSTLLELSGPAGDGAGTVADARAGADVEVAWRRGDDTRAAGAVTWGEFRLDVAHLCARLEAEPSGGWLLLSDDAYAFAVGLFALWHSGRHAILPPNEQPRTLRDLLARSNGVVTDRPESVEGAASLHPLLGGAAGEVNALAALDADALAVELYTSGTTGTAKPVAKLIRHLAAEVNELAECWDSLAGSATVFSTAPHHHLYGLLFGVLWPLCSRRVFYTHHFLHVGEVVPRLLETEAFVLVSVPTTLKRLARHAGAARLAGGCRAIFSSGGPLPEQTAHEIAALVGAPPIEVLGSTETGGIAWRQQAPDDPTALWTPQPSVRITREEPGGLLRVDSPYVSVGGGNGSGNGGVNGSGNGNGREGRSEGYVAGYVTGDRIELHEDGRFVLQGRADQIVKVGEKRLDLAHMAASLRAHEWVEDVALATIDRDGELRVAAVVVPSSLGDQVARRDGRGHFSREIRSSLTLAFDPILHPRYWRVVAELPADARGKVSLGAIRRLFNAPDEAVGADNRAEVLDEIRGADFVERACRVPLDLGCFPGHFPKVPVVPGVLQLDWALELAAQILGHPPRVAEIESLKLASPLRPGQAFRIRSRVSGDAKGESKVEIRLWSEADVYAVGRIRLEAPGEKSR